MNAIRFIKCTFAVALITTSLPAFSASNMITMKLEKTTNDHSLTLPKLAYTRLFDDESSLMFEKDWYWQEDYHDSGWPKHDEAFVNYTLPPYVFGAENSWSFTPQIGAKFRSNNTRALAALRLEYKGDGWSLATRYRYEKETNNENNDNKSEVGRIDIFATYTINDQWALLYNPHYHFKQESSSPDFGNGERKYWEHEFIAFYDTSDTSSLFGGYILRDKNSDEAALDPGQRNSSWLLGYIYKF
ncbi:oligogalacturonate-specific porin KdgM family protein [Phytohalomonas tamaricis]|uniref:oligogalacturonate-specific porin KdgM family protein n=1 Tax=Phytohalomonas tamaricis TaxID=2081032 RepID=UPI000D0AF269|nr:oligogalacturonate-specific porin KdgM family protein [Phytohalomonas tamaricis]